MPETTRTLCPECETGKHVNCDKQALDQATDVIVACECPCQVGCPDCQASEGTACHISTASITADWHAERERVQDLRSLTHGVCDLCGRVMVYGSVDGARVDAWHPYEADAAACPPLPDPADGWDAYATALNAAGGGPGHPGRQHFRLGAPPEDPEPVAQHFPKCNDRCDPETGGHYLRSSEEMRGREPTAYFRGTL